MAAKKAKNNKTDHMRNMYVYIKKNRLYLGRFNLSG